jgi:hypothetical protein
MSITYQWSIETLQTISNEEQSKIVFMVGWKVTGSNGQQSSAVYGVQPIKYDEKKPFILYENLTEQMVLGWVKESMGARADEFEKEIASQIAGQISPVAISPSLPWAQIPA